MTDNQLYGMEKFIFTLINVIQPIIEEKMKDEYFLKSLGDNIFYGPEARYGVSELSPKENYFRNILSGFTEIEATFQVLKDIPFYMSHFPLKNPSISKNRFLNYHIGNYLNEIYILRERLVSYHKRITRMYKKNRRLAEMKKNVNNLELLVSGFDSIVNTRGLHVHLERYVDEDFRRLNFYELINTTQGDNPLVPVVTKLYPLEIRDYRKKWIKIISENNNKIKEILDIYFEILYGVVFDKNGNWIAPDGT